VNNILKEKKNKKIKAQPFYKSNSDNCYYSTAGVGGTHLQAQSAATSPRVRVNSRTIDLHGMMVEEALREVMKELKLAKEEKCMCQIQHNFNALDSSKIQ